jgi:hypothetical protein
MDATRSTRSLLLAMAIAAASQIISACYPRPHEFTSSPEVSGVLLRGGLPVSGARVVIAQLSCDLESPSREFRQHVLWPKDKWGICENGS